MATNESLLISVVQRKNLFECYQIITELNCSHFPMKLVNHGNSSLLIMRLSLFFKKANLHFFSFRVLLNGMQTWAETRFFIVMSWHKFRWISISREFANFLFLLRTEHDESNESIFRGWVTFCIRKLPSDRVVVLLTAKTVLQLLMIGN